MNLQETIKRVLREDNQDRKERLKSKIMFIIKNVGVNQAISSIGGIERLIQLFDIENTIQFLNLFNDMEEVQSQTDDDFTLFRFREGLNYFELRHNNLFVHEEILKVVKYLQNDDIFYVDMFTLRWFNSTYNKEANNRLYLYSDIADRI